MSRKSFLDKNLYSKIRYIHSMNSIRINVGIRFRKIRRIVYRSRNTIRLAISDSANHFDALRELLPDGVETLGREHTHARQFVCHLVRPIR